MIWVKTESEIARMRMAGKILANTLEKVGRAVKPGVTTAQLNLIAETTIRESGATPTFKGYHGFPASICTSINEQVVHGIPGSRVLLEGDIISVDVGVCYHGWQADAADTFAVGQIDEQLVRLIEETRASFYKGIKQACAGNRLSDISHAIQTHIEAFGYSVVRELCGHGIGRNLHEEPDIPNFGEAGRGPRLTKGMTLAIEPMITLGGHNIEVLADGWTVVTKDRSAAAHFEHTIAITEAGADILTLP